MGGKDVPGRAGIVVGGKASRQQRSERPVGRPFLHLLAREENDLSSVPSRKVCARELLHERKDQTGIPLASQELCRRGWERQRREEDHRPESRVELSQTPWRTRMGLHARQETRDVRRIDRQPSGAQRKSKPVCRQRRNRRRCPHAHTDLVPSRVVDKLRLCLEQLFLHGAAQS